MRAYPLTESEMRGLAQLSAGASFCFTLALGFFGYAVNLHKDLAFAAAGLPPDVAARWATLRTGGIVVAGLLFVFGLFLVYLGQNRLEEIKTQTQFDDDTEPYKPAVHWSTIIGWAIAGVLVASAYMIGSYGMF